MSLKARYFELLDATSRRADPIGRVTQRDGVIRSALQVAALAALEIAAAKYHRSDIASADILPPKIRKLFHEESSDSLPIELLKGCLKVLESQVDATRIVDLRTAIKFADKKWKPDRNSRAHGSGAEWQAKLALDEIPDVEIERFLEWLSPLFPESRTDGKTLLQFAGAALHLETVPIFEGSPGVVAQRLKSSESGWVFPCRRCIDNAPFERIIAHDAPIVLLKEDPDPPGAWSEPRTFYVLPKRPAVFRGREELLQRMSKWLHTRSARAATLTGEGGIGKTALVVEFLHQQLDSATEHLPTLIVFHTAKKTRWGIHGLIPLRNTTDSLDDAVRSVLIAMAAAVKNRLPFRPGDFSGDLLLRKAKEFADSLMIPREEILLVIDNAETLQERHAVGPLLNRLASDFARIIVTSRDARYEDFESTEWRVKPLSDLESVALLKQLAHKKRGGDAIRNAGPGSLRDLATKLRGHPLLIHAYVELVAQNHLGMDDARRKLNQLGERDLAEFLYETAWTPLSEGTQFVLLALARLGGVGRKEHLGAICAALDTPFIDIEAEISTSYIVRVDNDGRDYLVEPLAVDWLEKKYIMLGDSDRARVEDAQNKASRSVHVGTDVVMGFLSEHESKAYRLSIAEAAAIAWYRREFDSAKDRFATALKLDPENAALYERFAAFLVDDGDANRALHLCDQAQQKGASLSEVEFTRANAHRLLRQFLKAYEALDSAIAAGRNVNDTERLRIQLVTDEIEEALTRRRSTTRTAEKIRAELGPLRQRAEMYLEHVLREPEENKRPHEHRERFTKTSVADRAEAYLSSGADSEVRRAAKALHDMDRFLIDISESARKPQ